MTNRQCSVYKARIKDKWWFSQCGRTWLVCRNPAEHLWCDFKCRPWAKNSPPNTNELYIHYMDKSTGTPSLEEKKALPNCGNKEINVLKSCISTSVATVLKCMKWLYPYVQDIGVWWWVGDWGHRASVFQQTISSFVWCTHLPSLNVLWVIWRRSVSGNLRSVLFVKTILHLLPQ